MSQRDIWFDSCGASLFATIAGDPGASPIALVHGGLADHRAHADLAAALAGRHRVITPDTRAAGRSLYSGPLSWDLLADDLAALLDALAIDRAAVGGTSAGAAVAVRFALRHPSRAAALAVLHPAFGGADRGFTAAQCEAMRAMHRAATRAVADGIDALLPLYDALPGPIRARARAMAASFDPASVAATTAFLASGAQPFLDATELCAIAAPTLMVPGVDPTHPPELAAVYAAIDGCAIREVDREGFAAAIEELLLLVPGG